MKAKKTICLILILVLIAPSLSISSQTLAPNLYKTITLKDIIEAAINGKTKITMGTKQIPLQKAAKILSQATGINIFIEPPQPKRINPKEYGFTRNDIYTLAKIARGDTPTREEYLSLTTKARKLGYRTLDQATALEILQMMESGYDKDPMVIRIDAFNMYINLKNSPWKMEHWLVPIGKYDRDHDRLADNLEKILEEGKYSRFYEAPRIKVCGPNGEDLVIPLDLSLIHI